MDGGIQRRRCSPPMNETAIETTKTWPRTVAWSHDASVADMSVYLEVVGDGVGVGMKECRFLIGKTSSSQLRRRRTHHLFGANRSSEFAQTTPVEHGYPLLHQAYPIIIGILATRPQTRESAIADNIISRKQSCRLKNQKSYQNVLESDKRSGRMSSTTYVLEPRLIRFIEAFRLTIALRT